jgi:hypothetical protein
MDLLGDDRGKRGSLQIAEIHVGPHHDGAWSLTILGGLAEFERELIGNGNWHGTRPAAVQGASPA